MTIEALSGKTIVITGGTGSFGETIVRRALNTNIAEVRIFSRDEAKQHQLRIALHDRRVKFYIGDVRQYESVAQVLRGAQLVFHAAALKQVPSCEFYPMEAIRTNALGAENVLNAAIARDVDRVVLLSSDKAVYPINAMGMTKALMEKLAIAKARLHADSRTIICATRYGNVMASRGSVIPLFVEQIKAGLPLTVTDPQMTRFMMSLPDSVDLVLHAYAHGRQGDILVQKAPATTVMELAQALCEIFESRSEIRIIGTRHGEKLYETLVAREEMARAKDLGRYIRIPADGRDLNYSEFYTEGGVDIDKAQDYTSHNTQRLEQAALIEMLMGLDYIQAQLGRTQARQTVAP
ncbi:polysaccharide biosynthesis protein [Variovorax sp. CCNWLW225]|uniref:polysaccharide biosynthesis protein n=1 Tax=Variovorax sp. CCNWLW225 TaxID=3127462 RepID=UPI003077C2D8